MTRWQNCDLEVKAEIVPRYFWTTVSIDTYLNGLCILRTGGQLRMTGRQSNEFRYDGESHLAELSWGWSRGIQFPYQLSIDGRAVVNSTICLRNWPYIFIPIAAVSAILVLLNFVID